MKTLGLENGLENGLGNRLRTGLISLVAGLMLNAIPLAELQAAGYPERTVTMVVPYPAGGVTDLTARALADSMSRHMGQSVVVVNRPGAGATIGGSAVATAAPDGYTLGFFPLAAATPEVFKFAYDSPYSSTDLRAIASVAATAMSFAVNADSPLKSMKDVVELARKSGGLLIGTPGKQTLPSMIMIKMASKEGVKMDDVAFGGDSKTLPALLGGHVAVAAIDYAALRSSVDARKIRVLAVCSETRVDFAPDVPTVVELGYELPYASSLGLFGPRGLPEDLVRELQELVSRITKEPQFASRMRDMSIQTSFKDSATYQKAVYRDRDNLITFFKQQGLLK
jgi:tripartite-type tricarboxylate transporter receptor subunit TctC